MRERKKIKLTKDIGKDKGLVAKFDEEKIVQVVNNILSNAIKFSPENSRVDVKAFTTDGFLRFECTDGGENIPADKLAKIFDKFERLDTDKKGSGLGLAIAKDIVELHKGKIWAESLKGKGNRFIFVLPRT
ncbi:MAG: HAMP domain-containing sensor histidine kinase, partial [Candidatus Omnitrophota bacterium]|jgi:two-component system sensor histidine kinase VicK